MTKLLVTNIHNPRELLIDGALMRVTLYDETIQKIEKMYKNAVREGVFSIEDFVGDVMDTLSEEMFSKLCADMNLPDEAPWANPENDFDGHVVVDDVPDSILNATEMRSLDRLDCCTVYVHKDGTFYFCCYLKHGDDSGLTTAHVSVEDIGIQRIQQFTPNEDHAFEPAPKKYWVEIVFGSAQTRKEIGDEPNRYEFDTMAELDAFLLGLTEMDGWTEFETTALWSDPPTESEEDEDE